MWHFVRGLVVGEEKKRKEKKEEREKRKKFGREIGVELREGKVGERS